MKVGTLNVGTMTGKDRELAEMMVKRKVYILCVQETKWKGNKARNIGDGFKIVYHGEDGRINGVGVILSEEYIGRVLEVKRVSDRMMYMKLDIDGVMMTSPFDSYKRSAENSICPCTSLSLISQRHLIWSAETAYLRFSQRSVAHPNCRA